MKKTGKSLSVSMDFSNLHQKQREIVERGDGVMIVNAGPGTGKTKTLTSRIAYLIDVKHVDPQNILALTFTNRAAGEMRERLESTVSILPTITTFHGFCYDLLKNWGEEFEMITEEERDELIKKIIKEQRAKIKSRDFSTFIGRIKNSIGSTDEGDLTNLLKLYNTELVQHNKYDFDDLLKVVFEVLNIDSEKRNYLQKKYQHILIDEFQDSNEVQYGLIKLILNKKRNLFVIGDPLQSIYAFRGANPEIFETIKQDFTEAREESLLINHRSTKAVVELSGSLFPTSAQVSNSSNTGRVALIETLNEYSEAEWIVNFINKKIGGSEMLTATDDGVKKGIDFSDFAILYRTHAIARVLEKKFADSGLPYQIVKEDSLLEGHHVKLLSMHAAKGLEFRYVFVCGFEEGLVPHRQIDNIDEEKRLLYVALTRAKHELYLLYTRVRNSKHASLSRFNSFFHLSNLTKSVDPAIEKIIEKQKKYKLKKAQTTLF